GHHHVEPAERRQGRCDGALDLAVDRHVRGEGERSATLPLDLGGEGEQPIAAAREQREGGALTGELAGQRGADPGRGPGDQRDVAREGAHGPCSVIASSAKAAAVLALRTASPWSRLVLALSWWALASARSFLASSISGLVSGVTLPLS